MPPSDIFQDGRYMHGTIVRHIFGVYVEEIFCPCMLQVLYDYGIHKHNIFICCTK